MKLNNYFALPKKYFAEEMVGRHEKWTGHNENKVGEEQRGEKRATVPLEDLIINLGGILSLWSTCLLVVEVFIFPSFFCKGSSPPNHHNSSLRRF